MSARVERGWVSGARSSARFGFVTSFARTRAAFAQDRSGTVAVLFALMTLVMCLFVGAGVDIGRWLHARQQTISAMDAAVLAGGRELQLNSGNLSGAIAAAQQFYAENTKGRMKLVSDTINFLAVDNNTAFTANGNAFIATPILGLVDIKTLPLLDTAGAEYSKAQVKLGGKSGGSVEIGLMLDVTGSMGGSKLSDMKAAAKDLVKIVVTENQTSGTARIAIVPFSEGVRLPSSANAAARGTLASSKSITVSCGGGGWGGGWGGGGGSCSETVYLTPCVVERTGTNKYTDVAPGAGNYVMAQYNDNGSSCALGSSAELLPLTGEKTTLNSKIDGLQASGSTAGQIGTAWAWYTLSPNWNTLWSSGNQAGAYGATNIKKIAILMTDGEYNAQYDSDGLKANASDAANGSSTDQARSLCTAMKDTGITVYTIGFDLGGNSTAIKTLKQCATDPDKFYNTDSGEELQEAFRDIALKISDLYLTQ